MSAGLAISAAVALALAALAQGGQKGSSSTLTARNGASFVPIPVQDLCAVSPQLQGPNTDMIVITREDGTTVGFQAPVSDARERWHRGLRMANKLLYPATPKKGHGSH